MSSTLPSQSIVGTRSELSDSIIPFYGVHPWFTHHLCISSFHLSPFDSKSAHYQSVFECDQAELQPYFDGLPDPIPLKRFIEEMERSLVANPRAQVGEVGLDRIFKLPFSIANYVTTPAIDSALSQFPSCDCHSLEPSSATPQLATNDKRDRPKILKTSLLHQQTILAAQIKLAIKHKRAVSCHSVQSSEAIIDAFRKLKAADEVGWRRTAICLHSFGGSAESARVLQKGASCFIVIRLTKIDPFVCAEHSNLFFSFSKIVSERSKGFTRLVQAVEPHRILLESDHSNPTKIDGLMLEIFDAVAAILEMSEGELLELVEANWRTYIDYAPLSK